MKIQNLSLDQYFETPLDPVLRVRTVFIFSCGYESRSLAIYRSLRDLAAADNWSCLSFGFSTFRSVHRREENEQELESAGISPVELAPASGVEFVTSVFEFLDRLAEAASGNIRVVVDYSSMPRNWYTRLMAAITNSNRSECFDWWYAIGDYSIDEYPCVGYGEFQLFAGVPRANIFSQVHIFGLGFDSTRTYGIWNFLDPQYTIALIGHTENNGHFRDAVREKNREVISASSEIHEVRLDQFDTLLSSLIERALWFRREADVALVADGPKPLILAMSLIPLLVETPGVFCWHVAHIKPKGFEPIDVTAVGEYFGFRLSMR